MAVDDLIRSSAGAERPPRHLRRFDRLAVGAVFVLAAALRLGPVIVSPGGLGGDRGYDPSVYYAAADALVHGRLPYLDFTLLHPPGLMLALTPFAAIGSLTSDTTGFAAANLAFGLMGAANAVLVLLVARRFGFGRGPSLVAGIFYAGWLAALHPEISIRLEPLGTAAFLLGLLALGGSAVAVPRRRAFVGGLGLGAAADVKIWWVAPLAVVVLWWVAHRRTRPTAGAVAFGAAVALAVVDGPFFLAAPSQMWRMVVLDQLGRLRIGTVATRISTVTSASGIWNSPANGVATAIMCVALLGAFVLAVRVPPARMIVAIAAVQAVVLIGSPSFFPYYTGYVSAGLALVVGAAATRTRVRAMRLVPFAALASAAVTTVAYLASAPAAASHRFPSAAVDAAAAGVRCVMADTPEALIEADVLTRDLRDGCPNWVDVTGRTYDVDRSRGRHYVGRAHRAVWQRDLRAYLLSGRLAVVMRPATGVGPALRRDLDRRPHERLGDGVVVYGTTGAAAGRARRAT